MLLTVHQIYVTYVRVATTLTADTKLIVIMGILIISYHGYIYFLLAILHIWVRTSIGTKVMAVGSISG